MHALGRARRVHSAAPDVCTGLRLTRAPGCVLCVFSAAASPPDVRQGYALPSGYEEPFGATPRFGLWPEDWGHSPNRGRSPSL